MGMGVGGLLEAGAGGPPEVEGGPQDVGVGGPPEVGMEVEGAVQEEEEEEEEVEEGEVL